MGASSALIVEGHSNRIWAVCYSREVDILLSCGEDETIKLWDIKTGDCVRTLGLPRPYQDINITGVTDLTAATLTRLKALGAVEGE